MKRTTIILSMFLIIVCVLTGCSNVKNKEPYTDSNGDAAENELYQVLIYDHSASVASAKIEYVFADNEKYDDIVVDDHIELSINNISHISLVGKYDTSQYRGYNYFPVHRYEDEKGISFEVDDSGLPISCFWGDTSLPGTKKTKDECIEIARDFLASIVNINDYDIDIDEDPERGSYTVKFTKSIHGLRTTDSATIVVKNDGELYSYSSYMLGRVTEESISTDAVDLDKVKRSINNKLTSIYKDAENIYSRIEYGEPDIMLTVMKDGKTGVVCTVDVSCIKTLGEYESRVGEKISFVVMVD